MMYKQISCIDFYVFTSSLKMQKYRKLHTMQNLWDMKSGVHAKNFIVKNKDQEDSSTISSRKKK